MKRPPPRLSRLAPFLGLHCALAVLVAGCGGSDGKSSALGTDASADVAVTGTSSGRAVALAAVAPGAVPLTALRATASGSEGPALVASAAIDGNVGTRWSSAFTDNQSLTLDFGSTIDIGAVRIQWEAAYAKRYVLQVSDDQTSWKTVKTVDNGGGGTEAWDGLQARGRYLRIQGLQRATPYGYSIFEVQAFAPESAPSPTAPLAPAAATASGSERPDLAASAAVDGDPATRWSSAFSDNQSLTLDFGQVKSIDRVRIQWEAAYALRYLLQVSQDGQTWTTIKSVDNGQGGVEQWTGLAARGRYLRMQGLQRSSPYGYSIFEIQTFAADSAAPAPAPAPSPTPAPAPAPAPTPEPSPSPAPSPAGYTPLSWSNPEPVTRYSLADGTLVTQVGGRVRDRHAREQADAENSDLYGLFPPHYFERRTHDITIYENASPTNPQERVLTLVVRPQWWWYGTNFRHGFIGRRDGDPQGPTAVALYGDNGGMKRLPAGQLRAGQELKTPLPNYNALPEDGPDRTDLDLNVPLKDGEFVLVKQITHSATARRALRAGDLVEFELGIFLSGKKDNVLGRFNYYADAMVYQVGTPGLKPWFRGPCCDTAAVPWDSRLIPAEALSGGEAMTYQEDTSFQPEMSLMQAGTNIAGRNMQPFVLGRRLFHTSFLSGAHSEIGNDTLFTAQANKAGPRFQQSACIQCHVNNGKSSPVQGQPLSTLLVLTGDTDANGRLVPDSRFGGRLSQGRITELGKTYDGRQAELTVSAWVSQTGRYADGTAYTLQSPRYELKGANGQALDLPKRMSVRTAPHMVGMGLLEAVPEATLAALATASRQDPDGTVGRLQIVPDLRNPAINRVGRFGWRATSATVEAQTMVALNADMGVTTSGLPQHICGKATTGTDCRAADAKGPELADADIDLLVKYTSLLAVPPQRHFPGQQPLGTAAPVILKQGAAATAAQEQAERAMQARVAEGRQLFEKARCTACHVPTLQTGATHRLAELRNQTIRPYSDLLLHDMGAELADDYPQGVATGQEWRTPPLWGLGVLSRINPNTRYLHDGRARTVEEAVLWHGGQGQPSRERFKAMSAADRAKLLDFVKSL